LAKAPDAFRTISEVAERLDTPAHVLRFWESKFTQVKPVKRAGGRRYYRPDDVALLGGIRALLHDQGLTIKSVQKVFRDSGPKAVMDLARDEEPYFNDNADIIDVVANVMPELLADPLPADEFTSVADRPVPSPTDFAKVASPAPVSPDNVVPLQGMIPPHVMMPPAQVPVTPSIDLPPMPAPRAAVESRLLLDLSLMDRLATAQQAAKLAPLFVRLVQLHGRMTAG
jgi:DNA-binding transcriptional MerR regulator